MEIRQLNADEVHVAAKIGPLFFKEGGLPGSFVEDAFNRYWSNLISSGCGVIICATDDNGDAAGVFGAIKYPDINNGDIVSTETFWFVKEEYRGGTIGIKLFDAYEKWAKDSGCKRIGMIHLCNLHPDGLGRLYERKGYKKTEVHYFKEIL